MLRPAFKKIVLFVSVCLTLPLAAGCSASITPSISIPLPGEAPFFSLLPPGYTEEPVRSEDEARRSVAEAAPSLGISDPASELGRCEVQEAPLGTFYRFSQEYEGIPVYGRTIVTGADADGNTLGISGNYMDMDGLNTEPSISEDAAMDIAAANYGEDALLASMGLTIYSLNVPRPVLAWQIAVFTEGRMDYCFVAANTGDITDVLSLFNSMDAQGYGTDIDGQERTFPVWENADNSYSLRDSKRGFSVYDAKGRTLTFTPAFVDENGTVYRHDKGSGYFRAFFNRPVTAENENSLDFEGWTLKDMDGNILCRNARIQFDMENSDWFNWSSDVELCASPSPAWENADEVTLMSRACDVYDFYETELGRSGYDGRASSPMTLVYNDNLDGNTTNAGSYSFRLQRGGLQLSILYFGKDCRLSYDTVAHEFAHSVMHSIVWPDSSGEMGAINEAYSDIFGEIIEDWAPNHAFGSGCDWKNSLRNFADPHKTENPYYYGSDPYWIDPSSSRNNGGVHSNSTVISHAAYLMWRGIDGSGTFEPLSTEELAELFYSALFFMPADCTFSQLRSIIQQTANIMYQYGHLTFNQLYCVSNAFFQAGIDKEAALYPVSEGFDLIVMGSGVRPVQNNETESALSIGGASYRQYDNYTLRVYHVSDVDVPDRGIFQNLIKSGNAVPVMEQNAGGFGILPVQLSPGEYYLELTDNSSPENSFVCRLQVSSEASNTSLRLYTDFGRVPDAPAIPPEDLSGSWQIDESRTTASFPASVLSLTPYIHISGESFSCRLPDGQGGAGGWAMENRRIAALVKSSASGLRERIILTAEQDAAGQISLRMEYGDGYIYWIRQEDAVSGAVSDETPGETEPSATFPSKTSPTAGSSDGEGAASDNPFLNWLPSLIPQEEGPAQTVAVFEAAYNEGDVQTLLECINPWEASLVYSAFDISLVLAEDITGTDLGITTEDLLDFFPLLYDFAEAFGGEKPPQMALEIGETILDGERALVKTKERNTGLSLDFPMIRSDGYWYITFDTYTVEDGRILSQYETDGLGFLNQYFQ